MTIRAVAWDIDGTLVDSEPVHLLALKAACSRYGADVSDLPDDRFVGVNMHDVWRELRPRMPRRIDRRSFLETINACYHDLAHRLRPMPHAVAAVVRNAQYGLRQVAVSNSARIVVDTNLALGGLGRYMEFSLSLDDVSAGKPSPEPYLAAAGRLDLPPGEIVAVEDSDTGATSARAAGLAVIRLGRSDGAEGSHSNDLRQVSEVILGMTRAAGHERPPEPRTMRRTRNKTGMINEQS